MTAGQIILLVLIAIVVYTFVKKYYLIKSIKHYNANEVAEEIKKSRNTILLDVRTAAERNGQKINGSIHIPVNELKSRINELNKFKDKEIICYCRTGNRSLNAASILKKNGFETANLRGGMVQWNSRSRK